jgi:hypothetical protein
VLSLRAEAQGWDLQALMQDMAQVSSSRVRFVETRYLALLTQPLELKGVLTYERPDHLTKHVQAPFDERLTVEGDALTFVSKRGTRVVSLRSEPAVRALVESVRATLSGDRARLERYYEAELSGTGAAWMLRLAPRDPEVKSMVQGIVLSGSGSRVDVIEVLEAGGDRSKITILHDAK